MARNLDSPCGMDCIEGFNMYTATIVFDSGRGFWFAESDTDHERIFVHQRDVVRKRFLKVNDRISYELAPSVTMPNEMRAVNVTVIGRVIARQISDPAVLS
jgi:cold shock CspA family protein